MNNYSLFCQKLLKSNIKISISYMFLGLNMVRFFMNCPYCNYSRTYTLASGQKKCAKCTKKFSSKKIQRDMEIINLFCENKSANECAKELEINYLTVQKKYELFRGLVAQYLEEAYHKYKVDEYDEYIYLPKSKKKIPKNIFDSQNFLTFCYQKTKVYNLLMPNLNKYKEELLDDGLDETYFKEFSRFMMFNKIAKTTKRENTITKFWNFFEESIVRYKGIENDNFIYYLKECEFKFNYTHDEAKEILLHLFNEYSYANPRSIP